LQRVESSLNLYLIARSWRGAGAHVLSEASGDEGGAGGNDVECSVRLAGGAMAMGPELRAQTGLLGL